MSSMPTRTVGDESVTAGRSAGQLAWYEFAAALLEGQSILDAGCGLGRGLAILRRGNRLVIGQNLDARLTGEGIVIGPLAAIGEKSFDAVTSIDVVEHVRTTKVS